MKEKSKLELFGIIGSALVIIGGFTSGIMAVVGAPLWIAIIGLVIVSIGLGLWIVDAVIEFIKIKKQTKKEKGEK